MYSNQKFTKDNLDLYLKELSKEFRKRNGKHMKAEIILTGGAAILANYDFREMTYDIDAEIKASSVMKDAINAVGDRLHLPNGWLNTDFTSTSSYSCHLSQYSKYYKTYSNVLEIRTINAEFLVAMKMKAGRQYKNDLSDIVGILIAQKAINEPLDYKQIENAILLLYGTLDGIPEYMLVFLKKILKSNDLEKLYKEQIQIEQENKGIVQKYSDEHTSDKNVNELIKVIKKRKSIN